MALKENDWEEVLLHLRRRVREAGLAEFDARISADFQASDSRRGDVMSYLSMLISALKGRSRRTYELVLDDLRQTIDVKSNNAGVDGIELVVSEADRPLFGVERLPLVGIPEYESAIDQLAALRALVERADGDDAQ